MLVARARGVDLTQVGSKKTGATNALRTLGKTAAAVVFLGDFFKAFVAAGLVYLASEIPGQLRSPRSAP